MFDLWANRPVNLFAEKNHNQKCGKLFPHCCVCQYFLSKEILTTFTEVEILPKMFVLTDIRIYNVFSIKISALCIGSNVL